jgi:hypothetical protein
VFDIPIFDINGITGGDFIGDMAAQAERPPVTRKRLGERAEADFLSKAAGLGFMVAKPWGDSEPFDFIVEAGDGLKRIQVKSAHTLGKQGTYCVRMLDHGLDPYSRKKIDAMVAYVVPESAWYVFPARVFEKLRSLRLLPGSDSHPGKCRDEIKPSMFERYRDAWWILTGERPAKSPAKTPGKLR